jgi:type IV pilus assembly protein PilP
MKKIPDLMRTMLCLAAAMFLWAGCDDPPKRAEAPPAVRKKIAAQAETAHIAVTPPAPVGESGQPVTAQAAAPEKPTPAAPLPKPNEPSPPTQTAQQAPAPDPPSTPEPAPRPQLPPPPPTRAPQMVAASTLGLPAPGGSADAKAVAKSSQVATLLNIQVPAPYDPKGKVDPFEPLLKDESAAAVVKVRAKTDPNRLKTPLEKLDLGQLKLVAIIAAPTGNRALVEESSGKGYIIKSGTFIGLNSGKVVDIKEGKVLVEEEFEDVYGKAIVQKKEITLPKPPGEL